MIAANCESSRMSVIDINGVLLLFDIEVKSSSGFGDLKPATAEDGAGVTVHSAGVHRADGL